MEGNGGGEPEPEGEYCMPSQVEVDNSSHEAFTVVTLEVKDYPGEDPWKTPNVKLFFLGKKVGCEASLQVVSALLTYCIVGTMYKVICLGGDPLPEPKILGLQTFTVRVAGLSGQEKCLRALVRRNGA